MLIWFTLTQELLLTGPAGLLWPPRTQTHLHTYTHRDKHRRTNKSKSAARETLGWFKTTSSTTRQQSPLPDFTGMFVMHRDLHPPPTTHPSPPPDMSEQRVAAAQGESVQLTQSGQQPTTLKGARGRPCRPQRGMPSSSLSEEAH